MKYVGSRSLPRINLLQQLPTPSDGSRLDTVGHRDYFSRGNPESAETRLFPILHCTKFKIIPIIMNNHGPESVT
jgi:hypothetical protein